VTDCKSPRDGGVSPDVSTKEEEQTMWRKPTMIEICTGAEINSYISAAKK
jgi:coenzyme PQQ precursor peptide PqqA